MMAGRLGGLGGSAGRGLVMASPAAAAKNVRIQWHKHWRCGYSIPLRLMKYLILVIIVSSETTLTIGTLGPISMSAPGRSRTDTGDPFRGSASSLGLRGRDHNTARAIAHR